MIEFLKLFNKWKFEYSLAIDIGYTKVLDWYIEIKQGNHAQYKLLFNIQDCDLNLCVSKAYTFLAEWLSEKYGGY